MAKGVPEITRLHEFPAHGKILQFVSIENLEQHAVDGSEIWLTTWDVFQPPVNNRDFNYLSLNWWVYLPDFFSCQSTSKMSPFSHPNKQTLHSFEALPFWRKEKNVSYADLGTFSLNSYPFSLEAWNGRRRWPMALYVQPLGWSWNTKCIGGIL